MPSIDGQLLGELSSFSATSWSLDMQEHQNEHPSTHDNIFGYEHTDAMMHQV